VEKTMDLALRLVSSGAYRDLEEPVIVTSGESLTPFYVNAEKLCGDPGMDALLAAAAERDDLVIEHACALAERGEFGEMVDGIAAEVSALGRASPIAAVSGGQRRDWLFSGPVARRLGCPHLSLYKQAPGQGAAQDRLVARSPGGAEIDAAFVSGGAVVHVVDMLTAASSCHSRDPVSGREVGWIPMLRARGAVVHGLIAVVSRRQGGEEALGRVGVAVRSLVAVDEAFLAGHSRAPAEAVAYYRDAAGWTREYLRSRGIGLLLPYFTSDAKKLPRLVKFLATYRAFLESAGAWKELEGAAQARLGRSLEALLAGAS
jgi:orotate phosphoribosyltransferase